MIIIGLCSASFVLAVGFALSWVRQPIVVPVQSDDSMSGGARRGLWWVSLTVLTALPVGLFVVGPGARLAMRIIAATSSASAQGRITEADAIVGEITADGTIGIIVFVGLFSGFVAVTAYVVLRRWLPAGGVGGVLMGLGLLVVVGPASDPIRRDNIDFDIVGPGWVSVAIFVLLAVATGLAMAGWTSRVSRALPLPSRRLRTWLPHAALVVTLPTVIAPAVIALIVGLSTIASQIPAIPAALRSRTALIVGRVVLALAVVAAAPAFFVSLVDIVSRG